MKPRRKPVTVSHADDEMVQTSNEDRQVFPVSVVAEGQGLNVTVLSYRGRLHFGLTSCRTLVPDLADLARGFSEGLETLRKRVDALAARVEG